MTGKPQQCTRPGCQGKPVARRLCRAHYQAAWKAGDLGQHEKQPPRVKNPTICPPEHKHGGSLVCYNLHQCRCTPCVEHRHATDLRRKKDKAYGRYATGLVDVTAVREHVLLLSEYGIGYKRVAHLAGFRSSTPVRNIIWGRQDPGPRKGEMLKRVKRETAEKILAVKPDITLLADGASIPARGTHRRLQALVARGWSQSKLADRIGMQRGNFGQMMQRSRVTVALHRRVATLFDELWDQTPPHAAWRDSIAYSRSIRYARARRWLPPLAWDDIDNDPEPPAVEGGNETVDEMAVELALTGDMPRLTPAERRECVRRLHRERWSDGRIADQLGCASKTVERIRAELGLAAFEHTQLRERGAA